MKLANFVRTIEEARCLVPKIHLVVWINGIHDRCEKGIGRINGDLLCSMGLPITA
jgi:hypothetical protein